MKNVSKYIAVALIAGCASIPPPTEQVALSKAAVANAVSAGAQEFAAPDLRSAQDKLERANVAMAAKDYEGALWLAEHAQADAELASARSRAAKAQKSVEAVQEDSRVLREELNRKSK